MTQFEVPQKVALPHVRVPCAAELDNDSVVVEENMANLTLSATSWMPLGTTLHSCASFAESCPGATEHAENDCAPIRLTHIYTPYGQVDLVA